ncbi:MAG TPA: hypothetical protein VJL61_02725 [Rhodanobacteraceae bacterium]|nr:hypothetical protein [Rhodanobacteraceae bacterium]
MTPRPVGTTRDDAWDNARRIGILRSVADAVPATMNITDDGTVFAVNAAARHVLRAGSRSNALHPATMPTHSRPCRSGCVQRTALNEKPFIFVSEWL